MFGYVIVNNFIGTERGFFSPFPRFVSNINRRFGGHWDYWSFRQEMKHRRSR